MGRVASVSAARFVDFDTFDPNKPEHFGSMWLVYGGWHSIRYYAQRGHAINRCYEEGGVFKLYEQINGRWELRAKADGKQDRCSNCNQRTEKISRSPRALRQYGYSNDAGAWCFQRDRRNKIITPLNLQWLCRACAQ